jgi:hypothetical protein
MIHSSNHFASFGLATAYYLRQDPEHTMQDTLDKVNAKEIVIGKPVMGKEFHQFVNEDGRWCHIDHENRRAVKK